LPQTALKPSPAAIEISLAILLQCRAIGFRHVTSPQFHGDEQEALFFLFFVKVRVIFNQAAYQK
jgi:hypothetical protein